MPATSPPQEPPRTLEEIASLTGHQLGNALGAVKLALQGLERHAPLTGRDAIRLGIALDETANLERMLSDLVLLAAEPVVEPRPLPVRELLERTEALVTRRRRLESAVRAVQGDVSQVLQADPGLAAEALARLVENAWDAGGRSADLVVTPERGQVRIEVWNDGAPLPLDVEPLFAPFVTTHPRRLGLGLPVALRLARAQRGSILLRPAPRGATAALTLPSTEALR